MENNAPRADADRTAPVAGGSGHSSRYTIIVWLGKCGSIFEVIDRRTDRVMGRTSTMRDGAAARQLADIQCAALNRKEAR